MWETILGAVVGGVLAIVGVVIQSRLSAKDEDRRAVAQARVALVRELMRYRIETSKAALPLNEVPALFWDDEEAVRLYRELVRGSGTGEPNADKIRDIIAHLCRAVGMEVATVSDIESGLKALDGEATTAGE